MLSGRAGSSRRRTAGVNLSRRGDCHSHGQVAEPGLIDGKRWKKFDIFHLGFLRGSQYFASASTQ
ncbi:unnamed protein product, partial [Nesidiocoris tenuis]